MSIKERFLAIRNDRNRRRLQRIISNTNICPIVHGNEIDISLYRKLPFNRITDYGIGAFTLINLIKPVASRGGEQLYRCVMPKGVVGELMRSRKGLGVFSAVVRTTPKGKGKIAAQAVFQPISNCGLDSIAPTIMFYAISLVILNRLNSIADTQKMIFEYIRERDNAILMGDLDMLIDIFNDYKHQGYNSEFRLSKNHVVHSIERDSRHSMHLHKTRIDKILSKAFGIHVDQDAQTIMESLVCEFKEYQLSIYLFAFSCFLEVSLSENYDPNYLDSMSSKIENHISEFNSFHVRSCEYIKSCYKDSIGKKMIGIISDTIVLFRDFFGLDRAKSISDWINDAVDDDIAGKTSEFSKLNSCCERQFVDNIRLINNIYNNPMCLLSDGESLFILED